MNPTGRDRWGPNSQRQMWTYIQQVETDGDTYSTGRNRRGHEPIDTEHMTDTQQVKTGPPQALTENRTTEAGEEQPASQSVRPK